MLGCRSNIKKWSTNEGKLSIYVQSLRTTTKGIEDIRKLSERWHKDALIVLYPLRAMIGLEINFYSGFFDASTKYYSVRALQFVHFLPQRTIWKVYLLLYFLLSRPSQRFRSTSAPTVSKRSSAGTVHSAQLSCSFYHVYESTTSHRCYVLLLYRVRQVRDRQK